jgi:hypothetical protein
MPLDQAAQGVKRDSFDEMRIDELPEVLRHRVLCFELGELGCPADAGLNWRGTDGAALETKCEQRE